MENSLRITNKKFWASFLFLLLIAFQTVVFAEDIDDIRELLKEGYFIPIPQEILDKPTIDEILVELDPYTVYFTKEEFNDFKNAIDMNYVGIGIIGEQHEQGVKVVYLFETGAAFQSDLKLDDIIIEVNGTSLTGKTIDEAQGFLLGSPGTTAHLKVYRPETEQTLMIDINRETTEIAPTVESAWLGGNIGYIRLNSFNEDSVAEMKKAMKSVGDVEGWIIDIRDNGGGYLDAAQDVAGLFPNVNVALIVEGRNVGPQVFEANLQDMQLSNPTFLLINTESASASEILAGAIKDQGGARIYGQTTFGKGIAQSVFELSSGNLFKMTVAQFYTPFGNVIEGFGIKPDVETDIGEELEIAHRDMLLLHEDGSIPLQPVEFTGTLPRNVGLEIELAQPYHADDLKERISLIELGGKNVEIEVEPTSLASFYITAVTPLKENSSYLLKIESGLKDYTLTFDTSDKMEKIEGNKEIFSDVHDEDFYKDSAIVLYNEGLLKGIGGGLFGPSSKMTREQVAVFFARVLDLDTENVNGAELGFADVDADEYYYSSVAAVKKAGIMQGKSENLFGTGDVLTRGEMAALLVRAFGLQNPNQQGFRHSGDDFEMDIPFLDVKNSPFADDILTIYQSGIAGGTTGTTFSPEKAVTRAEFVTFLYRVLLHEQSEDDIVIVSAN